jgi:chemotaxis protein MotB
MKISITVLAIAIVFLTSCVTKSKYQELDIERQNLLLEHDSLKEENEKIKKDLKELKEENQRISIRNEELSALNRQLVEKNKELSEKILGQKRKSMNLEKELVEKTEKLEKLSHTHRKLTEDLKEEIAEGNVKIQELRGMLKVNVVSEILFKSGSHDISGEGERVLAKVADSLKNITDKRIEIQGHTDDRKITGSLKKKYPTNWELSAARATTVVRILQDNGVDPEKLSAAGYGEYHPETSNETPEGRQQNRRIEIVLLPLMD